MTLEEYISSLDKPIVLADRESILKYCIKAKYKPLDEFNTYIGIGCWTEKEVAKKWSVGNFLRSVRSFEKLLVLDYNESDKVIVIASYPNMITAGYHFLEFLMPIIRSHGFNFIEEKHVDFRGISRHVLVLQKDYSLLNRRISRILRRKQVLDHVKSYTVNKEKGSLTMELSFKIAGISYDKRSMKLAKRLLELYPGVGSDSSTDKPVVWLSPTPVDTEYCTDPYGVRIMVNHNKKAYCLGWIPNKLKTILKGEKPFIQNKLIAGFIEEDEEAVCDEDKVIQNVRLEFLKTGYIDGKKLYWGKIEILVNIEGE